MRLVRQKYFTIGNMIDLVTARLDEERVDDYEVSDKMSKENINVEFSDNGETILYIPISKEYTQHDIDSFSRTLGSMVRTQTRLDRDIYIMRISKLNDNQNTKLIKKIIELEDFCTIINQ